MMGIGPYQGGLLALALSTLWIASGCGPDCDDLQEICDRCHDPNQKQSCEESVDRDDREECASNVDSFEDICR
jgi:hypothetical protein